MTTQEPPKRLTARWTSLKGSAPILLFLVITTLIEYVVVVYAIDLGVQDQSTLQWSFVFPGTDWAVTLAMSPLFHLVPAAVIVSLIFIWSYLAKHSALRPRESWKGKTAPKGKTEKKTTFFGRLESRIIRARGFSYIYEKVHFAKASTKSAVMVLIGFGALVLVVSLLAYPQLIYRVITSAYMNNPSLLEFIKAVGNALASVGAVFSSINNALVSVSPGFRDFAIGVGNILKPLADLNNQGKYLVFQNVAVWVSAFLALFYGEYWVKARRFRKKGKS